MRRVTGIDGRHSQIESQIRGGDSTRELESTSIFSSPRALASAIIQSIGSVFTGFAGAVKSFFQSAIRFVTSPFKKETPSPSLPKSEKSIQDTDADMVPSAKTSIGQEEVLKLLRVGFDSIKHDVDELRGVAELLKDQESQLNTSAAKLVPALQKIGFSETEAKDAVRSLLYNGVSVRLGNDIRILDDQSAAIDALFAQNDAVGVENALGDYVSSEKALSATIEKGARVLDGRETGLHVIWQSVAGITRARNQGNTREDVGSSVKEEGKFLNLLHQLKRWHLIRPATFNLMGAPIKAQLKRTPQRMEWARLNEQETLAADLRKGFLQTGTFELDRDPSTAEQLGEIMGSPFLGLAQIGGAGDIKTGFQEMVRSGGKDGKFKFALGLLAFVPFLGVIRKGGTAARTAIRETAMMADDVIRISAKAEKPLARILSREAAQGEKAIVKILPGETKIIGAAKAASNVSNEFPADGIVVSASRAKYVDDLMSGKGTFGNPEGVWITKPKALNGLKTKEAVAKRLALFDEAEDGSLLLQPERAEKIIVMRVKSVEKVNLRTPLDRLPRSGASRGRGFKEGGRTLEDAPEFMIDRFAKDSKEVEILGVFDPAEIGGAKWKNVVKQDQVRLVGTVKPKTIFSEGEKSGQILNKFSRSYHQNSRWMATGGEHINVKNADSIGGNTPSRFAGDLTNSSEKLPKKSSNPSSQTPNFDILKLDSWISFGKRSLAKAWDLTYGGASKAKVQYLKLSSAYRAAKKASAKLVSECQISLSKSRALKKGLDVKKNELDELTKAYKRGKVSANEYIRKVENLMDEAGFQRQGENFIVKAGGKLDETVNAKLAEGSHIQPKKPRPLGQNRGNPPEGHRVSGPGDSGIGGPEHTIKKRLTRIDAERSAVGAERSAVGAERSAVGALKKEISRVGSKNEILGQELTELRGGKADTLSGVGEARRRARAAGAEFAKRLGSVRATETSLQMIKRQSPVQARVTLDNHVDVSRSVHSSVKVPIGMAIGGLLISQMPLWSGIVNSVSEVSARRFDIQSDELYAPIRGD